MTRGRSVSKLCSKYLDIFGLLLSISPPFQVLGDVKRLWLRLCELQAASARPAVALGSPKKQRRLPVAESSDTDAVEEVPER